MKNPKDEDYYLVIPNPIDGKEEEFDLDRKSNVGLVMRLIRKREKLMKRSKENFDKLEEARSQSGARKIEENIQKYIDEFTGIEQKENESDESFQSRLDSAEEKLTSLRDSYPDEVIELQKEGGHIMEEIDRIGIKICAIILNPTNGIPKEYSSKKDYIEEFIADDRDIQDVISFFLSTLSSTTMLHRDREVQMKKRSNKIKEEEKED